ncbi:unnamed protein product [marine sediment metagenome]|uniref:Uncharacterized protein n=1 Tax=marine sediment metagenome TaxID=412755 RepID=X0TZ49_9ZZZZ
MTLKDLIISCIISFILIIIIVPITDKWAEMLGKKIAEIYVRKKGGTIREKILIHLSQVNLFAQTYITSKKLTVEETDEIKTAMTDMIIEAFPGG